MENISSLPSAGVPWSAGLRVLAARFGAAAAVSDGRERLTYRALCARAHALAACLAVHGVKPGESVGTLLPNALPAVWASYGTTLSGAAETPVSWNATADEIAWYARLAEFRIVVTLPERAGGLRALGLEPLAIDDIGNDDPGITLLPAPAGARGRILFTSGTTGRPKGVVYTHERRWIAEQVLKAALPFTPSPGSRIILMTPFPHGASLLSFAWCDYGGEAILLDGVDTARVLPLLRGGGIDAVFAPPTVLAKLAAAFGKERFSGVRCVFTGTQPLTAPLYEKACAMFGPVVRVTYGKSECFNPITVLEAADTHAHFTIEERAAGSCVGWAPSGVELEIRGDSQALALAGAEGEVWLRARHMSIGMIDAEGFKAHGPDGWHLTGDLGRIDARGRLWLTGRIADVIKTGGYRVNPDEIEALLAGMHSCGAVCVTSLPSEYWGEIIVAAAENAADGWDGEVAARLAGLSRHKHPRAYLSVGALPRNAQGKLSRRQLRELIAAEYDLADGPYPALTRKAGRTS
ncbi:MAG: acyl--CoA ligase [Betaproteobacteria bacterium]|nr:acyl--CoA ligase [Betaproteobacteria bacterium]